MNKILIVGHPQSGYQNVEKLLRARGMARAMPSRREGLMPDQMGAMLCQMHDAPPLHQLGRDRAVRQIGASPLWHGLAMDLMLGNIEQPLWGWSDPQAVHLLNYWCELDPGLHFILVYDAPQSAVTRTTQTEISRLTKGDLQQKLDCWTAFNACLLEFHLRHPQRSLLVHSAQVQHSSESTLQQIRARMDAPWADRGTAHGNTRPGELYAQDLHTVEDAIGVDLDAASEGPMTVDDTSLKKLVARALVQGQPGSAALYEELQASANLPLSIEASQDEDATAGLQAWQALVAQHEHRQHLRRLARQLKVGCDEARQLAQSHERLLEQERHAHGLQQRDAQQHLAAIKQTLDQVRMARLEVEDQNQQLLEQMHAVQQALEQQHQAAQGQARHAALEAQALKEHLGNLQHDFEVMQTTNEKRQPPVDTVEQNARLLQQLMEVQEALGRYHQENLQLKAAPVAPVAAEPLWFGAASRVRAELSYQLGAKMIHLGRNPLAWLTLPWALAAEIRRHRQSERQNEVCNLPPLSAYRDAHEAERVRQHLSYRLGKTYLTHSSSAWGWLRLPGALRREMKSFHGRTGP